MNDTTDKKQNVTNEDSGCSQCDYTLAFLVLRGWLGVRALFTGIEKFGAYKTIQQPLLDSNGQPDPSGALIEVKVKFYSMANYSGIPTSLKGKFANEALLPHFALTIFNYLLGPALLLTGFMLLVGLGTRVSLFVQGLMYIALTVGLILIHQDDGISWLGVHVALVTLALMLAKHNKFALLKKW